MKSTLHTALLATLLLAGCDVRQQQNPQQFSDFPVFDTTATAPATAARTRESLSAFMEAAAPLRDVQRDADEPETIAGATRLRIASYNCENLYDTKDDPKTDDDEFTPDGAKKWNTAKYKEKLINVAKAIREAGGGTMPAIIGLVEIENKHVLEDLRDQAAMKNQHYRYAHRDSPDRRGIDVALFYQTDKMKLEAEKWLPVKTTDKGGKSRDILYTKFRLQNGESLHCFVNHWPSMREGEHESEPKRIRAARTLRQAIDSINGTEGGMANIVAMGDFNSTVSQEAISATLGLGSKEPCLLDMMFRYEGNDNMGTHKYGKQWNVLDHLIVSANLTDSSHQVFTTPGSGRVCHSGLLVSQGKNGYYTPKRAFKGDTWAGGYSDHLPISLDIYLRDKR